MRNHKCVMNSVTAKHSFDEYDRKSLKLFCLRLKTTEQLQLGLYCYFWLTFMPPTLSITYHFRATTTSHSQQSCRYA